MNLGDRGSNPFMATNFKFNIMEKNLVYKESLIDIIYSDIELNTFLTKVNQVKEAVLQMSPEAANHTMRLEFSYVVDYDIEVSLGYYRYETDEEYQKRITKPERDRQERLNKLYAQIEQDKEETINYLKAIGAI